MVTTTPQTTVATQQSDTLITFIQHTDKDGFVWRSAPMGTQGAEHSIWISTIQPGTKQSHPVVWSVNHGIFGLQEHLTTEDARVLANALLAAAEHAERTASAAHNEVAA